MKILNIFIIVIVVLIFIVCGDFDCMLDENKFKDWLVEEILALEGILKKQMDNFMIDIVLVVSLIDKIDFFVDCFQQDFFMLYFLFKFGVVVWGIG